jgi:hypothetical protein
LVSVCDARTGVNQILFCHGPATVREVHAQCVKFSRARRFLPKENGDFLGVLAKKFIGTDCAKSNQK